MSETEGHAALICNILKEKTKQKKIRRTFLVMRNQQKRENRSELIKISCNNWNLAIGNIISGLPPFFVNCVLPIACLL